MTSRLRLVLLLALAAAASDRPAAAADSKKPAGFIVNADVCPAPDVAFFAPNDLGPYQEAVRAMLLDPSRSRSVILQLVVEESFKPPLLVAVDGLDAEHWPKFARHQVRVVRGKQDVWSEMMHALQAQQGSTFSLDAAHQRSALDEVSRAVETSIAPIEEATVGLLLEAWKGVLDRAQYVHEVLQTPDGRHLFRAAMDGTAYHAWAEGRGALIETPREGSLLDGFAKVGESLARLPELKPQARADAERALRERTRALLKRIARQESCLRPE